MHAKATPSWFFCFSLIIVFLFTPYGITFSETQRIKIENVTKFQSCWVFKILRVQAERKWNLTFWATRENACINRLMGLKSRCQNVVVMAIKISLYKLLTHQNFFKGFLTEKHQNIRILNDIGWDIPHFSLLPLVLPLVLLSWISWIHFVYFSSDNCLMVWLMIRYHGDKTLACKW